MLQNASANLLLLGDICNINTTFYFLVNATIPPYRIHPNIMSVSGKQAKTSLQNTNNSTSKG